MDPDYPCRTGVKKTLAQGPSPLPQCNPMHDDDYPCRTGVKKTLAQGDPPSGLPKCNPMHDPDYPCIPPGTKKSLMQLEKDPASAIP
jgi:hypothetical protein